MSPPPDAPPPPGPAPGGSESGGTPAPAGGGPGGGPGGGWGGGFDPEAAARADIARQPGGLTLILGGARSGKSRLAEALVLAQARMLAARPLYLATAAPADDDAEMATRIQAHRDRRGPEWDTREAPLDLAEALTDVFAAVPEPAALSPPGTAGSSVSPGRRPVLVDCLTLWLANWMWAEEAGSPSPSPGGSATDRALAMLDDTLARRPVTAGPVVVVSTEVGLGIVPDNALARRFRDHQGLTNQTLAARADRVVVCLAGLPLVLKDAPPPPPVR